MNISWYECEIITQIHHFGCRGLSVATIYGQGKIAESQGKVREKSGKSQGIYFPNPVETLEAAYQTILTILGNQRFNNLQMETAWKLIETCIQPINVTFHGIRFPVGILIINICPVLLGHIRM